MEDRTPATPQAPSFGNLLRVYRLRSGFSQEQLAERSMVSAKGIGAIEQGARRAPYRETVHRLAAALDLSAAERTTFSYAADRVRGRTSRTRQTKLADSFEGFPNPLTPFVEREEVDEIALLLAQHRLVTLTGSGGVGKTRTAIEAAQQRARLTGITVAFVDLSVIRESSLIVGEIALALRVNLGEPVDASTAVQRLADGIASRALLLVLDNCEHVVSQTAWIVERILRRCRSISILTTSRELLGMSSEVVYRLPSLQIPDHHDMRLADALRFSAIALFVQRTRFANAQFTFCDEHVPAIVDICRKLDGIPLAIELVAARLPTSGIEDLRARSASFLKLPGGRDLPPRQQTMVATIWWSVELLTVEERALLEHVCIFCGGFTLAAAEFVCSGSSVPAPEVSAILARLVDKSLVHVVNPGTWTRYAMLESIRTFGLERLDTNDVIRMRRRHAEWLAQEADAMEESVDDPIRLWLPEIDNARAAIEWGLQSEQQSDILLAARIIGGLRRLWTATNRPGELQIRSLEALTKLDDCEQNHAVIGRIWRARLNAERHITLEFLDQARPFLERAGDHEAVAVSYAQVALDAAQAGMFELANTTFARATACMNFTKRSVNKAYFVYASIGVWILVAQGELVRARAELLGLREAMRRHALDRDVAADINNLFAEIEFASGNVLDAIAHCEAALEQYLTHARPWWSARTNLCCYFLVFGDLERAEQSGQMSLGKILSERLDLVTAGAVHEVLPVLHLAAIATRRQKSGLAAQLLGFIDETFRRTGLVKLPSTEACSYDILTTSLSSQLAPEELERLRAVGARLDFQAAAELLLSSPPAGIRVPPKSKK